MSQVLEGAMMGIRTASSGSIEQSSMLANQGKLPPGTDVLALTLHGARRMHRVNSELGGTQLGVQQH